MKPENVHHAKFKVQKILLNSYEFSIAYGIWEDGSNRLGMRWNGDSDRDPGYPKLFLRPVWFMIPKEHVITLTKALLDIQGVDKTPILEALSLEYQKE